MRPGARTISTYDEKAQEAHYEKALQRIADQAYWIPLYKFAMNYLVSNDLKFDPPSTILLRAFSNSPLSGLAWPKTN